MNTPPLIPCLPESAPFTAEQRAYLNGFLAGLFSRAAAHAAPPSPATAPLALTPLSVFFGSQTGNGETLAKRIAKEAAKRGFAPTVHDLAKYPTSQLAAERHLLIITSTYGDGDPPDNAKAFWDFLGGDTAPRLEGVRFSLCALGDSSYPKFCAFGKNLDGRLEALGACRVEPRADCDVDYEPAFVPWLQRALERLLDSREPSPRSPADRLEPVILPSPSSRSETEERASATAARVVYSRTRPFPAPLVANRKLNGPGSAKDTRHFEFCLEGSELTYDAGDALGVLPTNDPDLVRELTRTLGASGTEPVPGKQGQPVPLQEALMCHYEIRAIPQALLQAMAARTGDPGLRRLLEPGVNGELTRFLWGREIIDLLLDHPSAKFAPEEFAGFLKKLQPRLYSMSSSPSAHAGQAHLTTAVVRYESLGRMRRGVCSTFLAERVSPHQTVPVFVHVNRHFRPPADRARSMIMVGPGTGIAPFRAFLHERRARQATGRHWLLFGDQHAASDFLYRDELEALRKEGVLTRLDTAFSRDQAEKVYVQDRMLEHARELFDWLEDGAHFYVCGDARRMAKDVQAALLQVIVRGGGRTLDQAADYVQRLRSEHRYQQDVY